MTIKITIAIPSHDSERTISETIESCLIQEYPNKEILIIDDASKDNTVAVAKKYPVRVIENKENIGIGKNLAKLMDEAKGKYVVYMCADDLFTNSLVVSDIVKIFDTRNDIGVLTRYYYQFMDGIPGAVEVERRNNIFYSCINPSGMAFRKREIVGQNKLFLEMPMIVSDYLRFTSWATIKYDTVAVRLHPGGNTGTKEEYYKESPVLTLTNFFGKDFRDPALFIQLKNCAPGILAREISNYLSINPNNMRDPKFLACAFIALVTPRKVLRHLCNFYRHRIRRNQVKIITREEHNA